MPGRLAIIEFGYCQAQVARRDFPKWNVFIQVMTEADALAWEARTGWNPFDLTKVWPHKDFPRIPVGVLELNRNPANCSSATSPRPTRPTRSPWPRSSPLFGIDYRSNSSN